MGNGQLSSLNSNRKHREEQRIRQMNYYYNNPEKVKENRKKLTKKIYNRLHGMGWTSCEILKTHHESTKDDPEHLSTDFIKQQIKKLSGKDVDCGDEKI